MDTTIDQQVAMDEALVPHAKRLRIGRSNFRLLSDISSKESTLQLVYDVLRLTSFFKAFMVTTDEFWATATVHHHSIRFKMDNKKHIVNLESFREMLHICPRLPHQPFVEPPFKEEILAFLRLTDVNINKLHQPWRSFAAIINKFLTGKSSSYDSLQLSQAQILWGLYHKRNVDFAYLMWEDFVYQVKHKDTKKSNEMYYPRNSNAYKEYYAVATGATPPKPKASVRKTRSSFDTTITPSTATAGPRLTTSEKGKQAAKASKAKSLSSLFEESFDLILKTLKNTDDEGNGEENLGTNVGREEGHDEEEEEEEDELYRDVNINLGRGMESIFETHSQMDAQTPTSMAPLPMSSLTNTPSTIATVTTIQQAPTLPTTPPSALLQDLPN
nr:hypothetical protein [Tanacetum cinerariifolium]